MSIFGPKHWLVADAQNNLGSALIHTGDYLEAERLFRDALDIRSMTDGPRSHATADTLTNLGSLFAEKQEFGAAIGPLADALAVKEHLLGKANKQLADLLLNLATAYHGVGDWATAEALFLRARPLLRAKFGDRHPVMALFANNFGALLAAKGDYDEAITQLKTSISIWSRVYPDFHPMEIRATLNLVSLLERRNVFGAADIMLRAAYQKARDKYGPASKWSLKIAVVLAQLLTASGNQDGALELLGAASEAQKQSNGRVGDLNSEILHSLAEVHASQGKFQKAAFLEFRALQRSRGVSPLSSDASTSYLAKLLMHLRAINHTSRWVDDQGSALFLPFLRRLWSRRFKSEVQQGSIDGMAE